MTLQERLNGIVHDIIGAILFVFLRFLLASIIVFPTTYFISGSDGPGFAVIGFFVDGLIWFWLLRNINLVNWQMWVLTLTIDVVYGLSYGILLPISINSTPTSYQAALQLISGIFLAGVALGWVTIIIAPANSANKLGFNAFKSETMSIGTTLVIGVLFPLLPTLANIKSLPEFLRIIIGLTAIMAQWFGVWLGRLIGKLTRALTISGWGVVSDLRILGSAGFFFIVGYLFISLFYSTLFAAIWRSNISSFSGDGLSNTPDLFDFIYFSIVTIATLGYGDIIPRSTLARAVAMSEVLIGLVWVTLVLASTVARLTKKHSDINESDPKRDHLT